MKKTITLCIWLLCVACTQQLSAQLLKKVAQRAEQKVKDRANRKLDETIDKGLDKVENETSDATKKSKKDKSKESNEVDAAEKDEAGSLPKSNSLKVDSKFDFVPGEKIVLFEDFTKDNIGDFPDKWNTNSSGEIVTLSKTSGRFLETRKETVFYPEWISSLPDNFTLEFDLVSSDQYNYYSEAFFVGMSTEKNIGKNWHDFGRFGNGGVENTCIEIGFDPTNAGGQQGETVFFVKQNGKQTLRSDLDQNQFTSKSDNTVVHIAIWRQKQRVRVYLNDKKVWDIPKALDGSVALKSVYFRNSGASNDKDAYYVGNIRLAVGAPDTRNKLITEGKFSTSGILFDVNSDKIKRESYGAVKEIANVLNENSDVKVKIIGHTDSDGDDAKNLELSKKRAAAVKTMLSKDFKIDANRMETDGKGETQPVAKNDSPEKKAQNRRVEFIKL